MIRLPISYTLSPAEALQQLADLPWPVLLESARYHPQRGRYSYFTADPLQTWTIEHVQNGDSPFESLRQSLNQPQIAIDPAGPPFQGGVIGLLSYELGHCWEELPVVPTDAFTSPPLLAGLYDWTLCWDHMHQQAWLYMADEIAPELRSSAQREQLLARLQKLESSSPPHPSTKTSPNFAPPVSSCLQSDYEAQVQQVIEYIRAGDIYQANLSRKIHYPYSLGPLELYAAIRKINPAPFAAYFQPSTDWALISASPEQFLQVNGREVITRPIKGTRPRWQAGDLDLLQGAELQASEKDRAENTMIVDLMRNDLSRVCQIGSVKVPRWCELETFEKVHHLVSEVTGTLRDDCDLWDLLSATFPGGSITGAPKIRAMEIISELEQTARGAYCGSLIAAGWHGTLQSSILIRTLIWKQNQVQFSVGGGIVADSVPQEEYAETAHKSAGLITP